MTTSILSRLRCTLVVVYIIFISAYGYAYPSPYQSDDQKDNRWITPESAREAFRPIQLQKENGKPDSVREPVDTILAQNSEQDPKENDTKDYDRSPVPKVTANLSQTLDKFPERAFVQSLVFFPNVQAPAALIGIAFLYDNAQVVQGYLGGR